MERGTRYLASSTLRALLAANARTPLARTGYGGLAAFAAGLPVSEFPVHHAVGFGAAAVAGVARGSHATKSGKLGLALTVGSAASLIHLHKGTEGSERLVELALADQLGPDYRSQMAAPPATPRPHKLPAFPSPKVRHKYVEHANGHLSYGEGGKRTTLDIWKRPDLPADGKAPVLFQVHGGAWMTGDKEGQAYPLMVHLAERGWICVSITYRLSPKATWPDHVVDTKRALAWVKEHIADYGGDPDWVAISGGSAGGHLTALTALTQNDPRFQPGFEDADTSLQAAVPFYGVYDWTNRDGTGSKDLDELLAEHIIKKTIADDPDVYDQASPMSYLDGEIIPMMLLHGANDTLVPVGQARAMVDVLRAWSPEPVVYVEYPGAQHAFDIFSSRRTDAAVAGIERFLNVIRARTGADSASGNPSQGAVAQGRSTT